MKVMVKGKIYDSKDEHVAILIGEIDKYNISNMAPEATVYSSFPMDMNTDEVDKLNRKLKAAGSIPNMKEKTKVVLTGIDESGTMVSETVELD